MQKRIEVIDYLREVGKTLNGVPVTLIERNALIFFNIFGINIVHDIIRAYEERTDASAEAYRCVFVLYKELGCELAEFFIKTLKEGCEAREKAKLQEKGVS